jgi:hypothetical protein
LFDNAPYKVLFPQLMIEHQQKNAISVQQSAERSQNLIIRVSAALWFARPRLYQVLLPVLAAALVASCHNPDPIKDKKGRTLTPDERYIVELYMKISEIEENLQDNPEEREKKLRDLGTEFDTERVRSILLELRNDPERWLTVYSRINELLKRRASSPAT